MKSRINLYLDELRPKKEFLTLNTVVLCWAALLTVLVAISVVLGYLDHSSRAEAVMRQSQFDQVNQSLEQAEIELKRKRDLSAFTQRIAKQKTELAEKQRLLNFMQNKSKQAELDYAQVMTDLATYTHRDVWLTDFQFTDDEISISGAASHGAAIPIWLNGLKQSQYFNDKAFSVVEFDDREPGVTFRVATKYSVQGVTND